MRLLSVFFLALSLVLGFTPARAAAANDPGDLFVNAYMSVQQGEKLEQSGNLKGALTKLRYAATVLDQIAAASPTWQPQIVSYRKSRTAEAIVREPTGGCLTSIQTNRSRSSQAKSTDKPPSEADASSASGSRLRSNQSLDFARDDGR